MRGGVAPRSCLGARCSEGGEEGVVAQQLRASCGRSPPLADCSARSHPAAPDDRTPRGTSPMRKKKRGGNPGRPRSGLRYEARRSSRMTASAIPGTASRLDGSPVRSFDQRTAPSSPGAPASRSSTSKAPERGAPSGFPTIRNAPGKACSTRLCSSSNRGS